MLGESYRGTFLEIGAFHSTTFSNTWMLENVFGWRGVAVELNRKRAREYNKNRTTHCCIADATTLNYANLLESSGLPKVIDYLQVDIEPAMGNLLTLFQLPLHEYSFKVITFEHDLYADAANEKVQFQANTLLTHYGYNRVACNVQSNGLSYEDWYINPEYLDLKIFGTGMPSETEWRLHFD